MIHRINVFLLSILIAVAPVIFMNRALANAYSDAGWDISNRMAQGASTIINGVKNVGGAVARGTAKITPAAADVSKVLARGAGGYALAVAVEQLLGAVDWVLDPANNRIKYYETPDAIDPPLLFLKPYGSGELVKASQACAALQAYQIGIGFWTKVHSMKVAGSGTTYSCVYEVDLSDGRQNIKSSYALTYAAPAEVEEPEQKSIPLEIVAQQVISNAEAGDAAAQAVTGAAANDIANNDAKAPPIISQLEATKTYDQAGTAAGTATKPNTADPTAPPEVTDLALEFPAFCGWAPIVCEAAQKVISFPNTLTSWWDYAKGKSEEWVTSISTAWAEVKDWVKTEEPAQTDTSVDIEAPTELPQQNSYFQWNAYCPFNAESTELSINGQSSSLQSDLTSWCDMAVEIRPFVLAAGALASFLIASGVVMRGDE